MIPTVLFFALTYSYFTFLYSQVFRQIRKYYHIFTIFDKIRLIINYN